MPGRRKRESPLEWADPTYWPEGNIKQGAPPSAALAKAIALRLSKKLNYKSKARSQRTSARQTARRAGLSPRTITNIIEGTNWPDIDTIARLENALDMDLWGDEHRRGADEDG